MHLDLGSLESVNKYADEIIEHHNSISILINNAGALDLPFKKTPDGFEQIYQINYLSQFLLTSRLYPLTRAEHDSRIVFIGSTHHKEGKINFNDLEDEQHHTARSLY